MERREAGKKEQVSARGTRLSMQHRVPSLGTSQTCHEDRHETMILKGSNTTHRTSDAYSSNRQRSQKNNHDLKITPQHKSHVHFLEHHGSATSSTLCNERIKLPTSAFKWEL